MKNLLVILVACCFVATAQAQDPAFSVSGSETSAAPASDPATQPLFSSRWSLGVFGGNFVADHEPQFTSLRNEYAFGFGVYGMLDRYPWLGLDFEAFYANRDYETSVGAPLWGTLDNDTSVQTSALLLGTRVLYPTDRAFNVYASAGLGYFYTRMIVYGSLFGFPGTYEDTDYSFEVYYGAGVRYLFGNWGLSFDYRHFNLSGDFGGFNISNANIGGDVYVAGWLYTF